MVLLTNTTITLVLQTQRKSGMFAFPWLMVEQCLHHHYIACSTISHGPTGTVPPWLMVETHAQIKKSVSISNRAVFAAPTIWLVCTVLAHFFSYNNTQQLQISSPPPWADRRKSQRDVFYLGRPIARILGGGCGGISHMAGKSAKVHCNGATNIKNFKK